VHCSLGAYHDGQKNDCSSEDQYVMAKTPTQLNDRNFLHPYQFSHCSVTYFRAYINELNTYEHLADNDSSQYTTRSAAFLARCLIVGPTG